MFIIEKKRQPHTFTLLDLLKSTSSDDETRQAMQHIFYEASSGDLIATDGRRIVVVYAETIPDVSEQCAIESGAEDSTFMLDKSGGIFKIECTKGQVQYPNYKRVLPELGKMDIAFSDEFDLPKRKKDIYHGTFFYNVSRCILAINQPVNIGWFESLYDLGPFTLLLPQEPQKAFALRSEKLLFVGMPMRFEDEHEFYKSVLVQKPVHA